MKNGEASTERGAAPVFIVGAMRSGTTLLRLMLDHHPEVSIYGEFEYSVRWVTATGEPALEEYYRRLHMDRVFRADGFRIDRTLGYAELVRSFLDQSLERSGKSIAGATVHSNFHYLPRFWPDARFIHIVRDPRDVSRSCIGMGWAGNSFHGTPYWVEPIRRWKTLEPTLAPENKHQVRYEALIRDPVAELTRICEFLGLTYDEAMLSYPKYTTYEAPDPSLTEQWRRKLDDDEVMWIEARCGSLMTEFGYEPTHSEPRLPSKLKAAQLAVQNRSSRIQRNIGVYGLPLYASWQVAKRMPHSKLQERILRRVDEVDIGRLK